MRKTAFVCAVRVNERSKKSVNSLILIKSPKTVFCDHSENETCLHFDQRGVDVEFGALMTNKWFLRRHN